MPLKPCVLRAIVAVILCRKEAGLQRTVAPPFLFPGAKRKKFFVLHIKVAYLTDYHIE